nr:hypothetical protein [Xenococcaceae cyanobacterium MO_167.B52]
QYCSDKPKNLMKLGSVGSVGSMEERGGRVFQGYPLAGHLRIIAFRGHIAGIYVSCDRNVIVHSAPANKMGHVLRDRDLGEYVKYI